MKFFISSLVFILLITNLYASENESLDDDMLNEDSILVEESDFQKLAIEMKQKSLGLVLMLHAEHCPYCTKMENEVLSPMVKSKDYDNMVLIRKLQIDEARDVVDFDGSTVEPSDISNRYDAALTPTLVFLDHNGNQRNEKMIGINTVELFGAYLDIEIDKLVGNLKKNGAEIVIK
ncbi:MAG: thioredoxin fold domain-containing protein [Cocleimonas sp.]